MKNTCAQLSRVVCENESLVSVPRATPSILIPPIAFSATWAASGSPLRPLVVPSGRGGSCRGATGSPGRGCPDPGRPGTSKSKAEPHVEHGRRFRRRSEGIPMSKVSNPYECCIKPAQGQFRRTHGQHFGARFGAATLATTFRRIMSARRRPDVGAPTAEISAHARGNFGASTGEFRRSYFPS